MLTLSKRSVDLALFTLFLVLAVGAFLLTFDFPRPLLPGYPGSAMFPRLVLATMGVLAALGLLRCLVGGRTDGEVRLPVRAFGLSLAALLAFAALMAVAGMEIAIFLFVATSLWLRSRRVAVAAAAGVAGVAVAYLLFVQVLSVHLPLVILPRYLW
mgnify:FL=1